MTNAATFQEEPGELALRAALSRRPEVRLFISAADRKHRRPHVHLRYRNRAESIDTGIGSFTSCREALAWLGAKDSQ